MKDDRYQFQPWYIKTYRWLRYVPFYSCWGLYAVGRWWLFDGTIETINMRDGYPANQPPPPNRIIPLFDSKWEQAVSIFRRFKSMAGMKMKHYWTLQEVLTDVRSRMK